MSSSLSVSGEEVEEDGVYEFAKTKPGPVFAAVENALRCAICRGISDPPVSLPCCQQAFCSLCIRLYLDSTKPRCPLCRNPAAQNQLQVCKEFRAVCNIWRRHRKEIVTAANAVAEKPAGSSSGEEQTVSKGEIAPSDGFAGVIDPSWRRSKGTGKCTGKLNSVHYHSMTDAKLKSLLRAIGLPFGGDKSAMIARHKRLVLLSNANADRADPRPRSELIKEVATWEREREREKAASKLAAAGLTTSSPLSLGSQPGSANSKNDSTPEVPPEMKPGFAALIAQARAKRKVENQADSNDANNAKRPRSDDIDPREGRSVDEHRATTNGSITGRDNTRKSMVSAKRSSLRARVPAHTCMPNGSSCEGHDGDDTQVLGIAGRMVRTRGPWRCVWRGLRKNRSNNLNLDTSVADGPEANIITSRDYDESNAARSTGNDHDRGERIDYCQGDAIKPVGEELQLDSKHWDETSLFHGHVLYVQPDSGVSTADPPPELLARSTEARIEGEYLIFVPSHEFRRRIEEKSTTIVDEGTSIPLSVKPGIREVQSMHKLTNGEMGNSGLSTPALRAKQTSGTRTIAESTWDRLSIGQSGGKSTRAVSERSSQGNAGAHVSPSAAGNLPSFRPDALVSKDSPKASTAQELPKDFEQQPKSVASLVQSSSPESLTIDLSQGRISGPSKSCEGQSPDRDCSEGKSTEKNVSPTRRAGADVGSSLRERKDVWSCPCCTFHNKPNARTCQMCQHKRGDTKLRPLQSSLL